MDSGFCAVIRNSEKNTNPELMWFLNSVMNLGHARNCLASSYVRILLNLACSIMVPL